jgi:hypothetical protein
LLSVPRHGSSRRRIAAFALLCGGCLLVAGGYVASAALRGGGTSEGARGGGTNEGVPAAGKPGAHSSSVAPIPRGSYVLFRSLDRRTPSRYGTVALAPLGKPSRPRLTALRCERVYFAADRGLCLAKGGSFGSLYSAEIFDRTLAVRHRISLSGIPSRVRVSPDGRFGSATTFVSGHSYATPGTFSTQTLLFDMESGEVLANLERFTVTRDGSRIDAPDFNFWGVTFAPERNRFYATLATGGNTYLVEGDVVTKTARVLRENVECPSVSPDGTRLAYKKLVVYGQGSPPIWQLHVLELATMKETRLTETRVVDDQVEWLDDHSVLYGTGEEVWTVPADGTGAPQRFLAGAASPAVLRS